MRLKTKQPATVHTDLVPCVGYNVWGECFSGVKVRGTVLVCSRAPCVDGPDPNMASGSPPAACRCGPPAPLSSCNPQPCSFIQQVQALGA